MRIVNMVNFDRSLAPSCPSVIRFLRPPFGRLDSLPFAYALLDFDPPVRSAEGDS